MATLPPIFTKLTTLLFLLIHLGCFLILPTSHHHRRRRSSTRHPSSPLPLLRPTTTTPTKRKPQNTLTTTWSFIKKLFSSKPNTTSPIIHHIPPSPSSSTHSLTNPIMTRPGPGSITRPGSLTESDFFPLRNDIYPCPNCGEIFQKPGLLDQHLVSKHAVSELPDDDPGKNIVQIIFQTGWPGPGSGRSPNVYRVMKIHNCPNILTRFEEYRETVKSTAAIHGGVRRRDERCIADGNELLRFHCATFLCDLGQNGNSTICNHQYCSVCGIIRVGFSAKMDGLSTFSNSWKGHVAVGEDIENEFKFMHVKRAMLVCRVIAGRVGYDSFIGRELQGVTHNRVDDEDELIVFNPSAVLPCFVIAYTV